MTIEVASTRLDQSQVLDILGGLLDNLVDIVAERVTRKITSAYLQAEIEAWADNHLKDRLDHWATYNLDIEGDIDRAIRDLDLSDAVRDAVQDLTFSVTVE